jgi:hypothetical protein
MQDEFEFRPLDFSDNGLERTSQLLAQVFPHAPYLTATYLGWLYRGSPEGKALGLNAFLHGEMVAHCAGLPLTARIDGVELRGILLVNAAADPRHMRRNLTRRTTDPMFAEAAAQGFAFAIAVGNKYSTLPLLTRFKMVGPLDARIGFGTPRRKVCELAPSFERVWSEEALRWRLANPLRPYSVRAGEGDLIVISPTGRRGIGSILYDGPSRWDLGSNAVSPAGPLRVWLGLDGGVDWRNSAFVPIPQRLRPSPLNFVFKDLSGGDLHPDPARIVFRAIDFDPY